MYMATTGTHRYQTAESQPRPDRGVDPHRERVVAAEVRRLERHLRTVGPMPRHRLAEDCGAERWREGTFEEALNHGLRQGILRELPLGWIEAAPGPLSPRSRR